MDALKVSQFRFTPAKDSREAGLVSYMDPYLTAARCVVYPFESWSKSVSSILIPDKEQVCPAADRLHGDVRSLGGPWDDDKLEGCGYLAVVHLIRLRA